MNIKIINACQAAGEHRDAGSVLSVGLDISEHEAGLLIRMGRAVESAEISINAAKPAEKKSGKVK